ncbi:enoyl-CoA hydratase [compost metagenome]
MNEMVAPEELDAAVAHTVGELLECAAGGVRAQKALLRTWEAPELERGLKDSIALFGEMYKTSEPHEYMMRFINRKR